MNGLMNWLEKYVVPVATKVGSQKHLVALRDAFIGTMPATMAGSIAVLLNAFLRDFPTEWGWTGFVKAMDPIIGVNGFVWTGTLAVVAVIFSMTLGYNLAKAYKVDALSGAVVSLAAFVMGLAQAATVDFPLKAILSKSAVTMITDAGGQVATADGVSVISSTGGSYFNIGAHLGGTGLFTAMLFGFISVIIFSKLMLANITIKMPEQVPPAVSKAFAAIIPATVALYISGIINFVFTKVTGMAIIDWISAEIQAPLLALSQGFSVVLLITFLVQLLWFFGIHGPNVLAPVLESIWGTAGLENVNAAQKGLPLPYEWVRGSFDAYVWMGGSGGTIVLIIAILLFSKRADQLTVAKLSLAPGIFNINEPAMFGLPIVLNAIYFIPFLLAPCVMVTIAYFATTLGLVSPIKVQVLWVMPPFLNSFLATGGDWRAPILTLINSVVAFAIWTPFVLAANKIDPNAGEVDA
ncbi:PTS sugar transporter subunit IIC [Carnobacterium divergens]|uniref:PTS sugar transporter subunit IIC n=1 Tax=Carnobacterium divergens TaxID=2748 RepID=UPI002092E99E|nr:PTS sugar transporter subunit IIC [Carnobacterium divergens]MCO6018289.1 PTS sugar transporter subunit IIC [Carnobacterium divergens]